MIICKYLILMIIIFIFGISTNGFTDRDVPLAQRLHEALTTVIGKTITLQSNHSGKYIRAGIGRNSQLGAVSNRVGGWEKFELYSKGNDIVGIYLPQSRKFVQISGNDYLQGTADSSLDNRTKFKLIPLKGGLYALQSLFNNKYVRAGIGEHSFLGAVSENVDLWEMFNINPIGQGQSPDDLLNQFQSLQVNDPMHDSNSSRGTGRGRE